MKNTIKKLVSAILAVAMLGAMSTSVFAADTDWNRPGMTYTYEEDTDVSMRAAEDGYITTLSLSANSSHFGVYRDYKNSTFSTTLNNAKGMKFDVEATMTLRSKVVEKNLIGSTELGSGECSFTSNNETQSIYIGECGSGKRAFGFNSSRTSGITCDKVELISA